ncbi:MAG: hypothetical protein PHS09_02675 [Candidatus Omnitrophica bacterium]|nr:hypothetical protein [Candidatus Omnitrophota bacterium]MDD5512352.1 hypothetical protein [Candidatus Omnitrophota bacterium]
MIAGLFTNPPLKLCLFLIVIITAAVYANSLGNSFVWDDYSVIVDNGFIKSRGNLPLLFSREYLSSFVKRGCCYYVDYSRGSGELSYRPMVTLSYFIDYRFWELNPLGYHLTNLFLHIANAILAFIFLRILTRSNLIALWGALFFALHPVNSEAVGVVSFRDDLLLFLFYLSSLLFYIRFDDARPGQIKRQIFYALSLGCFALALFSKEMALSLPGILLLYDCLVKKTGLRRIIVYIKARYLGYLAIFLSYIWVRFILLANPAGLPPEYPGGSFYSAILVMARVFLLYLQWILLGVGIYPTINDNPARSWLPAYFSWQLLVAVFLCLSAWLFAWRKRNLVPVVSFSLLWFFLTIFPVSNLAYPLGIYMASRYLYLPILGFCLLLPYLLYRCGGSSKASSHSVLIKRQISLLLLVLLLFYATRTFLGNALWKSNLVLWQKISSRYPQNGQAHKILGDNLRNSGATKRAIYEYKQAISLNPGLVDAYNQLGVISGDNRDYRQAIIYFKQAVLADPGYLCSYNNLAVTYARSGDLQKAEKIWKKMLFFDPKNKDARGNLRKLKQLGK